MEMAKGHIDDLAWGYGDDPNTVGIVVISDTFYAGVRYGALWTTQVRTTLCTNIILLKLIVGDNFTMF